jgi:hypothetical protein
MSRTIIINSSNIISNTNNSQFQYNFPGGGIDLKPTQKIGLVNLSMYYSTFNITISNNNNSYSYIWIDGLSYNVIMPDGFYDIDTINNFLHFTFVQNQHYFISSNGDYVYLITWNVNASRYSVELNSFGISTSLSTTNSWTKPVGSLWLIPTNFIIPKIVIPSNKFSLVVGFSVGKYPNSVISGVPPSQIQTPSYLTNQQFLSSFTPQVSPLSSYILTCSLINNNYAIPNNLIYSFSPKGTIGEQFEIQPYEYMMINCNPGTYSYFTLTLVDQNFQPVSIQDPNIIIQLIISD